MFAFGLITCLQGITTNYAGILATRFFLGLAETGMFPGCKYLNYTYITYIYIF